MRVCVAGASLFLVSGFWFLACANCGSIERHDRRAPTNIDRATQPAWRLACLAHRAKRREGGSDQEAQEAAVAAVQSVLPLPWKEASTEAVNAVAYATKYHSDWFWRGVVSLFSK
jgi:hypothetical protein